MATSKSHKVLTGNCCSETKKTFIVFTGASKHLELEMLCFNTYKLGEGAKMEPIKATVDILKGRPAIFINEKPESPVIYSLTDVPGGRFSWEERPNWNIKNFAEVGIRLFQVDLWLDDIWNDRGELNIEPARKQIKAITDIRSDAAVFIRFHVSPPVWWISENPDEMVTYADGPLDGTITPGLQRYLEDDQKRIPRHSFASKTWKAEIGEVFKRFLHLLAESPEGANLAGIQPATGIYGEFHYWGFMNHDPDTSPRMENRFREYLKDRYGTPRELSNAWGLTIDSFDTIRIPGMKERHRKRDGIFLDAAEDRIVTDYYHCQHRTVTEAIEYFCSIVKDNWHRPIIKGIFYGYYFNLFGRHATGGHLEPETILTSSLVDYLSAPQAYQPYQRHPGGSGQSRGIIESCVLHGKVWLDEMDQGTSLGTPWPQFIPKTLEEDVHLLRRNVLEPLQRGGGLWYYDFGPRYSAGSWDHPVLMEEVKRLKNLTDDKIGREIISNADVAVIFDTENLYYLDPAADGDPVTEPATDEFSALMFQSGVSFDMYYQCDLKRIPWEKYRAVVFANAFYLDDEAVDFIRSSVAVQGRHVVWIYLPGYLGNGDGGFERCSKISGFTLSPMKSTNPPEIVLNKEGFPAERYGIAASLSPLPVVDRPSNGDTVGFYQGTQYGAMAFNEFSSHIAWYSALPITNSAVLREVFRRSRSHIYSEKGNILYEGMGLITVHSKEACSDTIRLKNGSTVDMKMGNHSTIVIDSENGKTLLD
jgi:hypothetical protein